MTAEPEIVLLEFYAGRVGGHHQRYVRALEDALRDRRLIVWAPYRDGWAQSRRPWSVLQKLCLGWRAFHAGRADTRVVVVQDPWPVDVALLALASVTSRRRNAIAAFVLRRTGQDAFARTNPWLSRATRKAMVALIRRGWLYPVSDSALALEAWERLTGVAGTEVSIPPPPRVASTDNVARSGPVVALVGSFRTERGAPHYDAVIRGAVATLPNVTVHVQLGGTPMDGSKEIGEAVRSAWRGDPRVQLHEEYLSEGEYGSLLASADVVVLPYDPKTYTTGTSGVLHEAVALGAMVLTTPFAWAIQTYGAHPQVRFIEDFTAPALEQELEATMRIALSRRANGPPPASDEFPRSWERAIEGALERLRWRRAGRPRSGPGV